MENRGNIKTLVSLFQDANIFTAPWLEEKGISRNLQRYYLNSGWLEILERGAYKQPNTKVDWVAALNAIQTQTKHKVHIGGLTALELQGLSHYFRLENERTYLFSGQKDKLPKWFVDHNWENTIVHKSTNFLPDDIGLKTETINNRQVTLSTPERAILECLLYTPKEIDLVECYHLFEGLVNLKPKLVSDLLNQCNSIKVKRLFLYMVEKANHAWGQFAKLDQVDIGKGYRSLSKSGVAQPKYLITVPKELTEL